NNLFWNSYEGFQVNNYVIYTWQNKGWKSLDTIGGNKQSYTDTGLACNVPVTYKVSALAANGGFVSYSDSITITPFDTIKPKSPVLKYASVLPDRSIKLAWEWNTKSDVKYFEIWRNKDNGNWQKMSTVVYDSLYIDTQVSPQNSSYKYYVIAIDSCNILNRSMPSDTDRIINLNLATGGCIPYVNLSWTKYAELPVNVNQYEIQRSTDGINYTMAGTTNANVTNFRDTLVKADVGYFYKIKAVDFESGYSSYSDSSYTIPWIYPLADSTQIVFTTVQKTGETDGEIRVKWRKYDFNKDTFARGYNLYRSTSPTLPFKKIYTTFQPNDTTYIDALKNTSDSLHFYYVSVYNSCNIDGPKSIVHQPVNLNIENRNLEAVLRWNTYKGAAVNYYEIYKSDNKNPYRKIAVLNSVDSVYSDTNILCKQVYKYQVFAYLQNGNISVSDIESITSFDTIPPVKPDIQAVSVDVSHLRFGQVSVKFTGNNEPNRSGYRIFSKDINGNFNLAGENFDLQKDTINWTITPVNTSLSPFTYFVTAFDSCGNISTPSDTHTTVFLQAKAYSMFIQLDWTNYIGFKKNYNYKIQRRKTNEPWMEIANVSSTVLSLRDSSAECNVYYAYRILTEEDLSGAFSYSNIAGDTAFETEQPMAPVIKYVSVISPNNIEINWKSSLSSDAAAYHIYRSEDNGATWNQIAYNVNDTAYIDAGINTYNTVYQYKIETLDKCGNLSADFSAPHGSIKLRATAGNEKVDINWNAYFGWLPDGYKLYRDGNLLATLSGNTLAYIDTNVLCINSYSYKVMAYKLDTDSLISWSNPDSARPFDTNKPQKVYLKYATVSMPNKQVSLNWEASKSRDAKEYRIMRRNGNTGFYELAGITNATTFTDSFENISNAHCYYIETYDYCGNRSEWSNPGCIIVLSGESKPGKNILSWNAYSQWNKNISHYNIYRNDDSTGWRNINAANNTVYEDIAFADTSIQNFCYKVEAVESGTNINSFSTVTCLQQEPIVYIPNAFTPDLADGINDKFRPEGLYIKSFKISIYNRWGQLVYENNNAEGWNGKYRGKYAPTDIYLYKIIVESYSGVESFFNGTVILLR
ncbi:MAG: T9SS type B sorting domain-containing protein, partial [Bacteroidia bacterium]